MSISFVGSCAPQQAAPGTSVTFMTPGGAALHDLAVIVLGFEGRAAGSGPWVDPTGDPFGIPSVIGVSAGWKRILYQPPSATGDGLEVWAGLLDPVPQNHTVELLGSYTVNAIETLWRGVYGPSGDINDGAVRAATSQQWTGDDPECPSVFAYADELLIAVGAHHVTTPGFGVPTPPGWNLRQDVERNGSFANVSCVIADKIVTVDGDTGAIPFNATGVSGTVKGATATLAVRPTASVPTETSPLIAVEFDVAV